MTVISLNDTVRVELTDLGMEILWKQHDELNEFIKSIGGKGLGEFKLKLDEGGFYQTQLWSLIDKFGPHMSMGKPLPFYVNIELVRKAKNN